MNFRNAAIMTLSVVVTFTVSAAQQPAGERGRGPADPFAGQPRINALVVSGGCCHDYALQGRMLMDAVSRALPVDWTLVVQGGRGTRGTMPVYAKPDWSKGFDIVIHNECLANVDDAQYHPEYHLRAPRRTASRRHSLRDALLPRRDDRRLA